jgi:hypothetical protein
MLSYSSAYHMIKVSAQRYSDGRERVLGEDAITGVNVELSGASDRLESATVLTSFDGDKEKNTLRVIHLAGVLKTVVPEWEGSIDWLTEQTTALGKTKEQTYSAEKVVGDKLVSFQAVRFTDGNLVTVGVKEN